MFFFVFYVCFVVIDFVGGGVLIDPVFVVVVVVVVFVDGVEVVV